MLANSSFRRSERAPLTDVLEARAAHTPDKVAYRFLHDHGEETITYSALHTRASTLANILRQRETRGTPVALVFPSGLEFVVALFACMYAGAIATPVSVSRKGAMRASLWLHLGHIAKDAGATLMLSTRETAADLATTAPQLIESFNWFFTDDLKLDRDAPAFREKSDPHAPILLQYTSGSTAIPKGAVITSQQLIANLAMWEEAYRLTDESVIVNWLPHYHDLGLLGHILHAMFVGASCVMMDPLTFIARPESWLEAITKYRGTFSGAPNFGYEVCINKIKPEQASGFDLQSWRVALNGAEPVRVQTIQRFAAMFASAGFRPEAMCPAYGLAEATAIVAGGEGVVPAGLRCFASDELMRGRVVELPHDATHGRWVVGCGWKLGSETIAIVDPDNVTRSAPGTVGEIWVSGRAVASGYWQKPIESEAIFGARLLNEADAEDKTYLRTGDLGFILDEQLYLTGRLKDTLVVRGAVHYPHDIEQAAETAHPAFRRSGSTAAFQVDSGDGEEQLVVLQEVESNQVTPDEYPTCLQALRNIVADQHGLLVHTVCLLERGGVLKTTSGKIRRAACRQAFLTKELPVLARSDLDAETPVDDGAVSRDDLLTLDATERVHRLQSYVLQQLAKALRLAADQARILDPQRSLLSQGMDSLTATNLAQSVERVFGVKLRLEDLLLGASAAQTAAKIEACLVEQENEEEIVI